MNRLFCIVALIIFLTACSEDTDPSQSYSSIEKADSFAKQNKTIDFKRYTVNSKYQGAKPKINFSSKVAKKYKTVISKVFEKSTVDFAGYYSLLYLGCGSPCQQSVCYC
ncbi:hypothetical protein [Spartinivicinus poritis]|uniref:Uncharacterized protein n=1 Tax=Spartinivicinus poritis TaxID=2994640 RepID=A0ABT5UCA7_9GAMM|nr:hypothetical protein [Spartinivicinus sp. A2-2]MDE1464016.1 hypothetical protein [Spartinivicinus sp. A2-2]